MTFYPGGLLRCDPPSPASVQPVLPVEDKRDRTNLPYRAPPTCSQPFCPYPIMTIPQQFEVSTLQMAKRVTMRVHSPRFPKFGRWETPRPELANSTQPPMIKERTLPILPSRHISSLTHSSVTSSKNSPPTLLTPFPAKNLLRCNQSVPTGPPYISTPVETPSQEDPHLMPQSGSPNQPQKVLPARIVCSSSNSYSSLTWKWNGTYDYSCKSLYHVSNIC